MVKFDVSDNAIRPALGAGIALLGGIRSLNASQNCLEVLDDEVTQLSELRVLNASSNTIVRLPRSELWQELQFLTELNLSRNALRELPAAVGTLPALVVLRVAENELESLPPGFFGGGMDRGAGSSALSTLDLGGNHIADLDGCGLNFLSSLRELCIARNRLRRLPDSLAGASRLELLDARRNVLEEFPELPRSSSVHSLLLSHNNLTALRSSSSSSSSSTSSSSQALSSSDLVDAFPVLRCARSLSCLELESNKLVELPPCLGLLRGEHFAILHFGVGMDLGRPGLSSDH